MGPGERLGQAVGHGRGARLRPTAGRARCEPSARQSNYKEPLRVSVKVEKLNPRVTLVYYGIRELTGVGDEQTAVRFTIGANGEVIGTNELKKSLLVEAVKSRT